MAARTPARTTSPQRWTPAGLGTPSTFAASCARGKYAHFETAGEHSPQRTIPWDANWVSSARERTANSNDYNSHLDSSSAAPFAASGEAAGPSPTKLSSFVRWTPGREHAARGGFPTRDISPSVVSGRAKSRTTGAMSAPRTTFRCGPEPADGLLGIPGALGDGDAELRGPSRLESRSSTGIRLKQHVERFVGASGGSMAEARHLEMLLQLEFRDVVRRGAEAEVEVECLRERLRQTANSRLEKEAADRHSFAGMALAHADASSELRSHLESADAVVQQSQMVEDALRDDLECKAKIIDDLERRVSGLTTSADVAHEAQMRELRKDLEQEQRQEIDKVRLVWEQRLSTAEEAYATARRQWEEGVDQPSCGNVHRGGERASPRSPLGHSPIPAVSSRTGVDLPPSAGSSGKPSPRHRSSRVAEHSAERSLRHSVSPVALDDRSMGVPSGRKKPDNVPRAAGRGDSRRREQDAAVRPSTQSTFVLDTTVDGSSSRQAPATGSSVGTSPSRSRKQAPVHDRLSSFSQSNSEFPTSLSQSGSLSESLYASRPRSPSRSESASEGVSKYASRSGSEFMSQLSSRSESESGSNMLSSWASGGDRGDGRYHRRCSERVGDKRRRRETGIASKPRSNRNSGCNGSFAVGSFYSEAGEGDGVAIVGERGGGVRGRDPQHPRESDRVARGATRESRRQPKGRNTGVSAKPQGLAPATSAATPRPELEKKSLLPDDARGHRRVDRPSSVRRKGENLPQKNEHEPIAGTRHGKERNDREGILNARKTRSRRPVTDDEKKARSVTPTAAAGGFHAEEPCSTAAEVAAAAAAAVKAFASSHELLDSSSSDCSPPTRRHQQHQQLPISLSTFSGVSEIDEEGRPHRRRGSISWRRFNEERIVGNDLPSPPPPLEPRRSSRRRRRDQAETPPAEYTKSPVCEAPGLHTAGMALPEARRPVSSGHASRLDIESFSLTDPSVVTQSGSRSIYLPVSEPATDFGSESNSRSGSELYSRSGSMSGSGFRSGSIPISRSESTPGTGAGSRADASGSRSRSRFAPSVSLPGPSSASVSGGAPRATVTSPSSMSGSGGPVASGSRAPSASRQQSRSSVPTGDGGGGGSSTFTASESLTAITTEEFSSRLARAPAGDRVTSSASASGGRSSLGSGVMSIFSESEDDGGDGRGGGGGGVGSLVTPSVPESAGFLSHAESQDAAHRSASWESGCRSSSGSRSASRRSGDAGGGGSGSGSKFSTVPGGRARDEAVGSPSRLDSRPGGDRSAGSRSASGRSSSSRPSSQRPRSEEEHVRELANVNQRRREEEGVGREHALSGPSPSPLSPLAPPPFEAHRSFLEDFPQPISQLPSPLPPGHGHTSDGSSVSGSGNSGSVQTPSDCTSADVSPPNTQDRFTSDGTAVRVTLEARRAGSGEVSPPPPPPPLPRPRPAGRGASEEGGGALETGGWTDDGRLLELGQGSWYSGSSGSPSRVSSRVSARESGGMIARSTGTGSAGTGQEGDDRELRRETAASPATGSYSGSGGSASRTSSRLSARGAGRMISGTAGTRSTDTGSADTGRGGDGRELRRETTASLVTGSYSGSGGSASRNSSRVSSRESGRMLPGAAGTGSAGIGREESGRELRRETAASLRTGSYSDSGASASRMSSRSSAQGAGRMIPGTAGTGSAGTGREGDGRELRRETAASLGTGSYSGSGGSASRTSSRLSARGARMMIPGPAGTGSTGTGPGGGGEELRRETAASLRTGSYSGSGGSISRISSRLSSRSEGRILPGPEGIRRGEDGPEIIRQTEASSGVGSYSGSSGPPSRASSRLSAGGTGRMPHRSTDTGRAEDVREQLRRRTAISLGARSSASIRSSDEGDQNARTTHQTLGATGVAAVRSEHQLQHQHRSDERFQHGEISDAGGRLQSAASNVSLSSHPPSASGASWSRSGGSGVPDSARSDSRSSRSAPALSGSNRAASTDGHRRETQYAVGPANARAPTEGSGSFSSNSRSSAQHRRSGSDSQRDAASRHGTRSQGYGVPPPHGGEPGYARQATGHIRDGNYKGSSRSASSGNSGPFSGTGSTGGQSAAAQGNARRRRRRTRGAGELAYRQEAGRGGDGGGGYSEASGDLRSRSSSGSRGSPRR